MMGSIIMKSVLYIGMLYDIELLLNLEPDVDNIFVIDMVDLSYGTFIEGKTNSWDTLKERIKNIIEKKSVIVSENDTITKHKSSSYYLKESHRWNVVFEKVNLVFYAGYLSEEQWPEDVININTIISVGACFFSADETYESTKKTLAERCTLPLTHYANQLKHSKYKKINVPCEYSIGKMIINDFSELDILSGDV